ncbi:hypothetical protein RHSIM_RhsimUnG0129900 [Rhododendron simsii]|uniref:non-specific serine/threonine protein kinase n=1 Tax=Rhododendron simsii TaxID=118357 RepID=A0A834FY61_RHOSS|nr:hypothetical protein RHSIM_RhsimUnG0129900 [Rhododendron simsii]
MLQFMVWFASAVGGVEIICICFVWLLLYKTQQSSTENTQGYLQVASGFRKFTYDESKKATETFREEIGRGGSGVAYKGVLSNRRVAAIKRLNETNHGEAEFLVELSTIRRVNHMNLIETWGYCLEGNHRLLVYDYGVVVMEMVTGKSPMTTGGQGSRNTGAMEQRGLVKWVREKMNGNGENELWLEEIIDPVMKGKCDLRKVKILVQVALECLEEDKDARPTMRQVIERLLPR